MINVYLVLVIFFLLYLVYAKKYENFHVTSKSINDIIIKTGKNKINKSVMYNINKYTIMNDTQESKAVKFTSQEKSYIHIPTLDLSTFTFKLFFRLDNADNFNPIAISSTGNWKVYIEGNKLIVDISNNKLELDTKIDHHKFYFMALSVTSDRFKIHLNGEEKQNKFNYLGKTKDIYIGKLNNKYIDGYIGKINIVDEYEALSELCNFSKFCKKIIKEEDKVCNYVARGKEELDCIELCINSKGEHCNFARCKSICKACANVELCEWKKGYKSLQEKTNVLKKMFDIDINKVDEENTDTKCKFIPNGKDLSECQKKCLEEGCELEYCQKVCSNCIDNERCLWIKPKKPLVIKPKRVPRSPNIKAIAFDKYVLLQWKYDNKLDGGSPITNYIIMVKETFNNLDGVRINMSSNPDCDICEHKVTGLKNQVYYDISIRAVNNEGLGDISNIETVSPVGPKDITTVSSSLLETDRDLASEILKDSPYQSTSCGANAEFMRDNHILNKKYNPLINFI